MKHSLKDGSGYLIIDHTDSPGIKSEDIPARLRDSVIPVGPNQKFESDIQQCSHCQRAVVFNANRTRPRATCPYCYHYICDSCDKIRRATGQCIPFKKVLDEAEKSVISGKGVGPLIKLTDF